MKGALVYNALCRQGGDLDNIEIIKLALKYDNSAPINHLFMINTLVLAPVIKLFLESSTDKQ